MTTIEDIITALDDYNVTQVGQVGYSKPTSNAITSETFEVMIEHADSSDIPSIHGDLQGLAGKKARARLVSSWPISSELYLSRFEVNILS
jgi:hypothetical protein